MERTRNPGISPVLNDTSDEANEVMIALLRERGTAFRLAQAVALSERVRILAIKAIKRVHPEESDAQVRARYLAHLLCAPLPVELTTRLREYSP
jgi:hypothetical protein